MLTSSTPSPMLATKRQRSMLSGVFWNAMMKAPTEYQSNEKVKIERRPKRSDSQLKAIVPMNSPANSAATKLAKPCRSNNPVVVGLKMPALNSPSAT